MMLECLQMQEVIADARAKILILEAATVAEAIIYRQENWEG